MTAAKAPKKAKKLSVKKETIKDLDVSASKGKAVRGGGGKSAKCMNTDACATALATCAC